MQSYEIKLNLEQIKEKHISFSKFNSLQEFLNLVKDNIGKNRIIIYKKDENIIRFEFKKKSVFFELKMEKITMEKLVENLKIAMENYENKFTKIFNQNNNMEKEINELKKSNEIIIEENKKLQEKIKKKSEKENLSENINNEIQDIINVLIEKEEIKKKEDNKLEIKIIKLNKNIQDLKNEIEKLKNSKEKFNKSPFPKNTNSNEKQFFRNFYRNFENNKTNNNTIVFFIVSSLTKKFM